MAMNYVEQHENVIEADTSSLSCDVLQKLRKNKPL